MENELEMNSNLLVEFLQKPSSEFTKADIISFIREKESRWSILCIRQETAV